MLKLLKLLFRGLDENSSDNLSEAANVETKKCINCLRRVNIDKHRCTYCGSSGFHFSEN
jgi:rRNA maturation endonuclease Nob1